MNETRLYRIGDPIGVHVLSEFVFCPRAMLVTHAQAQEDCGRESAVLRLDFSPCYDLVKMQRRLEAQCRLLWQLLCVALVLALLGVVLSLLVNWLFFWTGLLATIIPGRYFVLQVPPTLALLRDYRQAGAAPALEPNPELALDEQLNWWSLRAAGFVAHPVEDILTDQELGLQGRPWRILRRGDLAIPAYVRSGTSQLRPQQRTRVAAYCRSIHVSEGAQSPYGIALDRGTFAGTAVKPSESDKQLLRKASQLAPHVIQAWIQDGRPPSPPEEDNFARCKNCPHGRPVPYDPESTETLAYGQKLPVYRTRSRSNPDLIYHSPCGDHFDWIPHHHLARQLDLRPTRR